MRWETGRDAVERLLADGDLDRISPDLENARDLLESARRHLSSARKIRESDPEGAYAALYDAARKACGAFLEAQGLRATSRGDHVAPRQSSLNSGVYRAVRSCGPLTGFGGVGTTSSIWTATRESISTRLMRLLFAPRR